MPVQVPVPLAVRECDHCVHSRSMPQKILNKIKANGGCGDCKLSAIADISCADRCPFPVYDPGANAFGNLFGVRRALANQASNPAHFNRTWARSMSPHLFTAIGTHLLARCSHHVLSTSKPSALKAIAVLLLSTNAWAADAVAPLIDGAAYTQPQRMVEVESGRRLNLYCVGTGSPTVVFEAGLGVPISSWGSIQPVIAQKTRACAYDRAGLGFSDVATRASTSENIVDDLHRLLVAAAVKPPYVLVAHSFGGLNARLYAYTYPSDVVGMVLVDPTVEDQTEAYRALDPKKRTAEQWDADIIERDIQDARGCVAAAVAGLVPGTELFKKCISDPFPQYSEAVNATNQRMEMQPSAQRAGLSEMEHAFRASSDQVRAARRSYGDLPLIVLSASRPPPKTPFAPEEQARREARFHVGVTLRDDVAKLSSRGVNEVVANSRHYIQFDQPQAVIDAIAKVLAMSQQER